MKCHGIIVLLVFTCNIGALFANNASTTTEAPSKLNKLERNLQKVLKGLSRSNDDDLRETLIPDKVKIPPFNISNNGFTSVNGQFTNITLYGLQSIEIDKLSTDFVKMEVNIGISFESLALKGLYVLEAGAGFWTYGPYDGDFALKVYGLTAVGNAYLNVTDNSTLVVGDLSIDLEVNYTSVDFENLVEKSSFLGGIVNQLSGMLFDSAKEEIIVEIKKIATDKINGELKKIPKAVFTGRSDDTTPLDLMLKAAAIRMKSDGLDPFAIPFIRESFSKKVFMIKLNGEIRVAEGRLEGLSSIHRTGDIDLNLENNVLVLEANLGFNALKGDFIWGIHFLKMKQYGRGKIALRKLAISVKLTQEMEKGKHPVINRLKITEFGQLGIDLEGLGPFNSIFENLANLVVNAMKSKMVKAIEKAVKKELQSELEKISLYF